MNNLKDEKNKDLIFYKNLFLSFDDLINLKDYMNNDIFNLKSKNLIYIKIINNIITINDEIYILLVLDIISKNIKEMSIIQLYNLIPSMLDNIISQIILKFKMNCDPDYSLNKYKINCFYYLFLVNKYKNERINNKKVFDDIIESLNIKDNIEKLFTHSSGFRSTCVDENPTVSQASKMRRIPINNKDLFLKVINKLYNNKYNNL